MKLLHINTHNNHASSDKLTKIIFKVVLASSLILVGCEVYVLIKL